MRNSFLFFIALTLITIQCPAAALPKSRAVPGGIVTVPIKSHDKTEPQLMFQDHRVAVVPNEKSEKAPWFAIVGIPLSTKPGRHTLKMTAPITDELRFSVHKKNYRTQFITIKDRRKVTPHAADRKRIEKEKTEIKKALTHWSDASPFKEKFIPPVHGRVSSTFGLRRFYNRRPRDPHSGIDIAAAKNTEVKAPADGVVLQTGDYFYSGNTIIIDHGHSLITTYSHLNSMDVKAGDYVARGKVIGTIGKTGRATGPHLHWEVILNHAKVDPLLFVSRNDIITKPTKPTVK